MPAEPDRPPPPKGRKKDPTGSGVFISYRREDASGFAGRLHHSLSAHFGAARVFRDVDTIKPGQHFPDLITSSLQACGAFVVIIGREWLVDTSGRRRLDDPEDWVRVELEAALRRDDVIVVPVLVEKAPMPAAADLPESLAPLATRHALEVSDSRWDYDVKRLTDTLEEVVGPATTTWRANVHRWMTPRSALGAVARLVAAAAILLGLGWGAVAVFGGSPKTSLMTGDYNIAVAQFVSVDANGRPAESTEAHALAQSVYDLLDRELATIEQGGFDLNLRPPGETGQIKGSTPQRRAAAAAEEAERIRADVIVYGTLRVDLPNQFAPEFFLSERRLQNAEELFGQHDLGSAIRSTGDIGRNPVARKALRDQVLGRTRALAEFIVGLSYYGANQIQPAFDHFEAARQAEGWGDRDGKEVLYLFLGNAAGKLDDLDRADGFYGQALGLNPEYSRARLGRAEVLLHRSRGNCESGNVDVAGLTSALDTYRSALTAKAQPALSDIPTKVAFGTGRVHLCLSQALVGDHWAEAERAFQQVVGEFRGGNARVREMAAEAYANLGFVHLPASGDPDAAGRYRQSASDYQSAIDLTGDDERKAFFFSMRGFVFGRLGDTAQADQAYATAIELTQDSAAKARYAQARQSLTAPP
ncbi:MAG: TIR domain-containing protein [Acidimicrobiales bacterium]